MTLTLYGAPRSRAAMVRWYLDERQIPFVWEVLDLAGGEQRLAPYRAIHPFGQVPALVDSSVCGSDGQPLRLFESGAILLHLAEHHGHEFQGEGGAARRSLTAQWLFFANATFGPAMVAAGQRPQALTQLLEVLDPLLASAGSLLGGLEADGPGALSAADCALRAYLAYLPLFCPQVDLTPYPAIRAAITATGERQVYRRVMAG